VTPAVFVKHPRNLPETYWTDLRKLSTQMPKSQAVMPETSYFYRAYLRTACVGDGRARIPLQYVLTEVIVGQGLDVAQEQMPGWWD